MPVLLTMHYSRLAEVLTNSNFLFVANFPSIR
jgi:hypothetical protein